MVSKLASICLGQIKIDSVLDYTTTNLRKRKLFICNMYNIHNEELHSLYRSHNIVRVIKFRRLIWAGHVVRMEEGGNAF